MNKKGFTLVELLGVIILLGILATIAVVGYSNYLGNSKKKAFTIEEENFISATRSAYADCISNKTDNDFCSNHPNLETKYTYQFVYLKELIDDNYIRVIKNPYNVEQACDSEKSYVYVGSKNDADSSVNSDIAYKVCLICGDHKSKDCLDDDTDYSSFETTCKAYYDTVGGELYDGAWTDRNVVLEFGASGNYRYGINEYNYSINDSGSYIKTANSNDKTTITLNNDVKSSNYKVYALDGMNKKGTIANCGTINIDKGIINSVNITGKTKSGANVISDKWAMEEVILTANVNPSNSASGYLYQWYLNGEKYGDQTTINTLTVNGFGTYQVEVTNKLGKTIVKSNEFVVKIDTKSPTCTLKVSGTLYNEIYTSDVTIQFDTVADKENDNFDGSGVVNKQLSKDIVNYNKANEIITGTVTDGVGRIGTCSVSITRDNEIPNITAKSGENKILNTDNKAITDYFDIKYGVSGGNTVCKVGTKVISNTNDLTLGINTVTCIATGNNGMTSSAITRFVHQYYADSKCSKGKLDNKKTTCSYSEKTGTKTTYNCNSYPGYTLSGDECIKKTTETTTDTKEITCSLWKSCTTGTVTGHCKNDSGVTISSSTCYINSKIEINDGKSKCESNCAHSCSTHKYSCSVSSSTTTGKQLECGSESASGSRCSGAKSAECPNGYSRVGTTTTCTKTIITPKTDTQQATPVVEDVYKTTYVKPTYSCLTTGTNTSTNTTVSPELGEAICPGNKCSSVPLCTFKEN